MPEGYLMACAPLAADFDQLITALPPVRQAAVLRCRLPEERLRRLAAGLLLRQVLGVVRDEQLALELRGRPYLTAGAPCFSLSHSGKYALLVVDGGGLGADLEQLRPFPASVARRQFTQTERDWAAGDDARLFTLWTRKESLMKALGQGLSLDLRSLSLLPDQVTAPDGSLWHLTGALFDGHAVSAASALPGDLTLTPVTPEV